MNDFLEPKTHKLWSMSGYYSSMYQLWVMTHFKNSLCSLKQNIKRTSADIPASSGFNWNVFIEHHFWLEEI